MTQREKLIELILNAPRKDVVYGNIKLDKPVQTAQTVADHLLANGVVVVDTNTVNIVNNIEPIQTAFGMPLDELADLIRAKRDGRIIVPPCKVGDTVYAVNYQNRKVTEIAIRSIEYDAERTTVKCVYWESECRGLLHRYDYYFYLDEIGKTVFLTREEAEKALAERSEGK